MRLPWAPDEEQGPRAVFADSDSMVLIADLSGDGLGDLVRIRNGEVCYWPSLGYGRFGAKVTMDRSPWFDAPDQFEPARIRLGDIDGSALTSIVYMGRGEVRIYRNESGNRWAEPERLTTSLAADNLAVVQLLDLHGSGTSCLVEFSSAPADARVPVAYIDLMSDGKPHLLTQVTNSLGAETEVRYAPSTAFYRADGEAGRPWRTRLPFPVHVVERVITEERISGSRSVTRYAYSDGRFDEQEREFCGFGLVRQWDAEELAGLAPTDPAPVLTKTWFHTGVFTDGDRVSRHYADEYYADPGAALLEDTVLPDGLTPADAREACRALRGNILRQEVYGRDGSPAEDRPYAATERNATVRLLQPAAAAGHAVVLVLERERVELHYERAVTAAGEPDPRTLHDLLLDADEYGNALRSVSIAYGRRHDEPDPALGEEGRRAQRASHATLTERTYTRAIEADDARRAPIQCEARTYELHGLPDGPTQVSFVAAVAATAQAGDGSHDLRITDVAGAGAVAGEAWRRLIQHDRTLFRRDDLTAHLPLGETGLLAVPFESYRLALPTVLIEQVYVRPTDAGPEQLIADPARILGTDGGYVRGGDLVADGRFPPSPQDDWWMPSGRVFYAPDEQPTAAEELQQARQHFFLARRFRDPLGHATTLDLDQYDLLTIETHDPLGNRMTCGTRSVAGALTSNGNDYRVLAPTVIMDPNRNRSEVAYDALGLVVATAVGAKPGQRLGETVAGLDPDPPNAVVASYLADPLADPAPLLGRATSRLLYDRLAYRRTAAAAEPDCAVTASLTRESHDADLPAGAQNAISHRFTYSDGMGRAVQAKALADGGRWVCSGWTEFNAKQDPVRRFEPFFSATHRFERSRAEGVATVLVYDPLQRVIVTLRPDKTWDKVELGAWRTMAWDGCDTAAIDDPRADPDVGHRLAALPRNLLLPTWLQARAGGALGGPEHDAATQAAAHADTPARAYTDALGRTIASVRRNRYARDGAIVDEQLVDRARFDVQGNARAELDARGRLVAVHDFDLLRTGIRTASMDSGTRWMLSDAAGRPIYAWDSLGRTARTTRDPLGRPADTWVSERGGAPELIQRTTYGESRGASAEPANLRGRPYRMLDAGGETVNVAYDFKGNVAESRRWLAAGYRGAPDWSRNPPLEPRTYTTVARYDALNRVIEQTLPDGSVVRPRHDERGLVVRIAANVRGAAEETVFLRSATYDAKGEPETLEYGNGVTTSHEYDALNGRLRRLVSARGAARVQDLAYTYDPCGNVTSIVDGAQQALFFSNSRVTATAAYTYDAIYRLIEATGREHVGQLAGAPRAPTPGAPGDPSRTGLPHPNDGAAMAGYVERYRYDEVGNLTELVHRSRVNSSWSWTRTLTYDHASLLEPGVSGNRLAATQTGGDRPEPYRYDARGNTVAMPHLPLMAWDAHDRLAATAAQVVTAPAVPETTYHVRDPDGVRVRKVTDRYAPSAAQATSLRQRIYLGAVEIYQELDPAGRVRLERETLRIEHELPIALVETRTVGQDRAPAELTRYQLADRLHTVTTELDGAGRIISKAEYHPYGSTAYQAVDRQRGAPRRLGFTGHQHDEESGFVEHGVRSYAPWLARWTSPDPAPGADGPNPYLYARANPATLVDAGGARAAWPEEVIAMARMKELEDYMNARAQKLWAPIRFIDRVTQSGSPGLALTARRNRVLYERAIAAAHEGEPVINTGSSAAYFRNPAGDIIATLNGIVDYKPAGLVQLEHNGSVLASMTSPLAAFGYLVGDAAGASRQTKESLALTGGVAWQLAIAAAGMRDARQAPLHIEFEASPGKGKEIRDAIRSMGDTIMELSRPTGTGRNRGIVVDFVTNNERGPVLTGVFDPMTGEISFGLNQGLTRAGTVAPGLHPAVLELIEEFHQAVAPGNSPPQFGTPGSHSELTALSNALYAREEALFGERTGTLTAADMEGMVLHNYSLQSVRGGGGVPPMCCNCRGIVPPGVIYLP